MGLKSPTAAPRPTNNVAKILQGEGGGLKTTTRLINQFSTNWEALSPDIASGARDFDFCRRAMEGDPAPPPHHKCCRGGQAVPPLPLWRHPPSASLVHSAPLGVKPL